MDPQAELQQWKAARQAIEAKYGDQAAMLATPDEIATYNGDTLSPGAQALTRGAGVGGQHFDLQSGQTTKNKGYWSQPESWIQLGLGGGLAGAGAAGLLPGALGGGAGGGGGSAASTVGGAGASAGGILGTASKIAGLAGPALAAMGQGRAAGRMAQTDVNQRQDQLALSRYNAENAAARTNLEAPGQRAHAAVQGDILANAQPFKWTGGTSMVGNIPVPQSSGGLSPGIFSANTRALGGQMSANALKDNTAMGGKAIGAPPPLIGPDNAGIGDNILNTASTVAGLTQSFGDQLAKYKKPVPPPYGYPPEEMG